MPKVKYDTDQLKLYVIKKTLMAKSVTHAIKLDKVTPVHEVYLDPDYLKRQTEATANVEGFKTK